jgi:hypothetical protein
MPAKKPNPAEMPSEDLLLAAIDRAFRHRRNCQKSGTVLSVVKEHLGLARDGAATTRLRPTWDALQDAGLIEQFRSQGAIVWNLTDAGHKRLAAARQTSGLTLPEAPQHRRWRYARTEAGKRTKEFHADLHLLLAQAAHLVDAELPAPSDEWDEMDAQLHKAIHRLGSSIYCLCEWPEPDDATVDKAPPGQEGRRNYECWPAPS